MGKSIQREVVCSSADKCTYGSHWCTHAIPHNHTPLCDTEVCAAKGEVVGKCVVAEHLTNFSARDENL